MSQISIPWRTGTGNIVLTLTGQGNDTVIVTSDTDNKGYDRQQTISFYVTDGAIRHTIVTSNGKRLKTADGHYLTSLDNSMKVTVTVTQPTGMRVIVTADNHRLKTADGHILRCVSAS